MALKAECVAAVSQSIGRMLSKAEQDMVEQSIIQSRTKLARQDIDGYRQMTEAQKIEAASKDAMESITHNAYKKKQVETLHIVKTAKNMAEQSAKLKGTRKGGKAGAMQLLDNMRKLEIKQNGLMLHYWRDGVLGALNAIPEKAFGLLHDQKSIDDFVKYLYNKDYKANDQIKQAVKAWEETTEKMRTHANSSGADIGKLDYAYLPQLHDAVKMKDKPKWMSFVLGKIDQTRYLDESGAYIGDVKVAEMLGRAYDQIITDGLAGRVEEGTAMTGKGGVRGRHDAHRAIHFKGADAHLEYAKQYGKGNLLQVMSSHVSGMTRDIATLEHFGTKPNSTFAQMLDVAKLHDGAVEKNVGFLGVRPTDIYDSLISGTKTVDSAKAEMWQTARSLQSAAKLGGALLSSMTDTVSVVGSAWYNGMPARQIANIFKDAPYAAGSKQYKAFAARQGIIADSVISSVNRWAEGESGYNIAGRMADMTFRYSLLNAWTDGLKNAFSVNLSFTLGELTRKADWAGLQQADRYRLDKAGVTPEIYDVWRKSDLDSWDKNNAALSPKKIMDMTDDDVKLSNPKLFKDLELDIESRIASLKEKSEKMRERVASRNIKTYDVIKSLQSRLDGYIEARSKASSEMRGEYSQLIDDMSARLDEARAISIIETFANKKQDTTSTIAKVGNEVTNAKLKIQASRMRIEKNESVMRKDIKRKAKKTDIAMDAKYREFSDYSAQIIGYAESYEKSAARISDHAANEMANLAEKIRIEAASVLIGYIQGQRDVAVNTSDIIHKGRMSKFVKGDATGEIGRSVMQFKSYPASLLSRQIDMFGDIYHSRGKAPAMMYAVSMISGLSIMGGVAIQAKQLAAGKDPREVDRNFMFNAIIQGGGLGFYGDILYTGLTGNSKESASKALSMVAGPLAGTVLEGVAVGLEGVARATEGDIKDTPAKLMRLAGSNIPFAPMDMWYSRTAFDRLFVDDLMEAASPGYFGRQKGRIRKEYGQKFWWEPTELMPDRLPDYGSDGQ